MEEKVLDNKEIEIDLWRLITAIMHKIWLVIIASLTGAILAGTVTFFLVTPLYQSSAMFYVNNSSFSVGDASLSLTNSDIVASKSLVDSYIVILKTRSSLNDVIDYAGVDRTYSEVRGMISAAAVNSTEIFEVVVTSPDPIEAEKIASAIAYILPNRISDIIEGTSAKVVDTAIIAASPSSPSYSKNILIGFMLGALLSVGYIVLRELFDTTIRTEEDVVQGCKYPVLTSVPNMASPSKGGYYYAYSNKKKRKRKTNILKREKEEVILIGENISFAASEAYKLLRTKVQFSFADEGNCRVIGVSSALAGEGKSLSSVNLAYSLAQLDKKVLLIDCDMRRPSIAQKLEVKEEPGLSNYLTRLVNANEILQTYKENGVMFHVISAGTNPPNPIELLSSTRMSAAVQTFREFFDYIILDLPPVEEVSDAMVASKIADGILLVVRQDYCDRVVLASAVRQFEFVDSRILGIIMNCTTDSSGGYGKKYGKYKKYYHRYRKYYAYSAEQDRKSESL